MQKILKIDGSLVVLPPLALRSRRPLFLDPLPLMEGPNLSHRVAWPGEVLNCTGIMDISSR